MSVWDARTVYPLHYQLDLWMCGTLRILLLHLSYGICVIFVMCCGDATCITMRNIEIKRCLLLRAIVGFSRSVDHTTSLDCIEGT
jgi:hypothetical protein